MTGMDYYILCSELWTYIYTFDPLHRENLNKVLFELLSNCVRRLVTDCDDVMVETCLHKNVNSIYATTEYWQNRGWCNVKCGSLNWPHDCGYCIYCNADETFCDCNYLK